MTDKERDDFDYEARMVIQQTMVRIHHLEDLEEKRVAREKIANSNSLTRKLISFGNNVGFGGSGGIELEQDQISKTLALHRAGILWYLNDSLKQVSSRHASQQEIRLSRQLAKTKNAIHNVTDTHHHDLNNNTSSIPTTTLSNLTNSTISRSESPALSQDQRSLDKSGNNSTLGGLTTNSSTLHSITNSSYAPDDLPEALRELTPQQITVLESENSALMDELELSLNKAKAAEKSLIEISQLQSSLSAHLSTQNDNIQTLLNESVQVHDDIVKANKQLGSAKDRNRKASKFIIYASLILAFILLFYDYLIS